MGLMKVCFPNVHVCLRKWLFTLLYSQMNQVGLRETVKSGDVRRFELTVTNQGGRSIEVWTMQASSKEVKAEWVANVQKLLIRQLCSIKSKLFRITLALSSLIVGIFRRWLLQVRDVERKY
jgi:hypothetical protein